jgi:uncharacterized protein (DUF1697 family)
VSAAAAKGSRDTVQASGLALYVHTPDGFGRSELAQNLFKLVTPPARQKKQGASPGKQKTQNLAGTARNWATATKLLSLCEEK